MMCTLVEEKVRRPNEENKSSIVYGPQMLSYLVSAGC